MCMQCCIWHVSKLPCKRAQQPRKSQQESWIRCRLHAIVCSGLRDTAKQLQVRKLLRRMIPCSDRFHGAGDAHYTYRNATDFQVYGNLEVHNRKELLSWLDKIIEGTQKAHNFHLVSDDEDVLSASVAVTPGSPVKLPTFITTR